jgi:hypothetical protein
MDANWKREIAEGFLALAIVRFSIGAGGRRSSLPWLAGMVKA